jgi:hypothetical protein
MLIKACNKDTHLGEDKRNNKEMIIIQNSFQKSKEKKRKSSKLKVVRK